MPKQNAFLAKQQATQQAYFTAGLLEKRYEFCPDYDYIKGKWKR